MSFKIIADTFSVARDSDHFILLKTLKKPRTEDQIWLAIEIINSPKYARATAQSILDTLEEVYFENNDMDAYERFESALKEVNLVVKNLKEKRGAKELGNINAIAAVFSGSELYLTQAGDAEAYLIRKGKLTMVSEGLNSRSTDLFVNIASGELLPEDKVVFSTSRLLRLATQSQLAQVFSEGVTEAVDSIREMILAETELSLGVTCAHARLPQRVSFKLEGGKLQPYLDKIKAGWGALWAFIEKKTGGKFEVFKGANRNQILLAILIVILILFVSVNFLMNGRRDQALRDEYKLRIEAMNQDLHVANTKGYANDKETANAILEKVETEAREILETNYFRAEALALLERVQETRDSINNTTRVSEAVPYIDLSKKNSSVEALGFVNLDGNFYAYEYNTLYEIILDQVLDPKSIDSSEVVIASTALEDFDLLVFLTQSGRVIEYDEGQFQFTNTEDESWKSAVDLAAYSKYIYLLSPSNNQIYKYARLRSNYSSASEYNEDADLTGGLSIAIDGNIYVLKKGGEIVQLYKSKKQPFVIEDMAADISEATQLYTSPELDNLYILDPVNKRVVVIEKEVGGGGRYRAQLVFEELDELKDLYVDKNEEKLYLLTGQQIYQVEL